MNFTAKTVLLRDGRSLTMRSPDPVKDAAALAAYLGKTAEESPFVLRSPGESIPDEAGEQRFLQAVVDSPFDLMIVAEVDGEIAGNCHLNFYSKQKILHRASVAIALLKKYWGQGIGTHLMQEMIAAARAHGSLQIELDYIDGNERGQALYEKLGFREYARLPRAFRLADGSFRDEVRMWLPLSEE